MFPIIENIPLDKVIGDKCIYISPFICDHSDTYRPTFASENTCNSPKDITSSPTEAYPNPDFDW